MYIPWLWGRRKSWDLSPAKLDLIGIWTIFRNTCKWVGCVGSYIDAIHRALASIDNIRFSVIIAFTWTKHNIFGVHIFEKITKIIICR